MRYSFNFIKEFVNISLTPQELAKVLTMAGMEVEELGKIGQDWYFDIEITTNRYDWLSVIGVAKEVGACLNKKTKILYPSIKKQPLFKDKRVVIESLKDCPVYLGRVISQVKIDQSPQWLKECVVNSGINSISNVVDITNYCMLKWGNPLHAFDYDKIEGDIYIRRAYKQEKFIGIDDKEYTLNPDNLVIADSKKVIALAGVMGAKNSQVDDNTKKVFLEAAIFNPLVIRQSRQGVGLNTDSSYRFERRVNTDYLDYASYQACELILSYAQGRDISCINVGNKPKVPKREIRISLLDLRSYLGIAITTKGVKDILNNLGCLVKNKTKDSFLIIPPLSRFDLELPVDIYEEIVRIYGLDNINIQIPNLIFDKTNLRAQDKWQLFSFKNEIRSLLASLSWQEIISHSIESEEQLKKLNQQNLIVLANPLRSQGNVLRKDLSLGMINAISYNLNRAQTNLKFFELANAYELKADKVEQGPLLSIGLTGNDDDFYLLKGVVTRTCQYLNLTNWQYQETKLANYGNALSLIVDNQEVGFLGKLNTKIAKAFDIKDDLFFAQLKLDKLNQLKRDKKYKPFSLYPWISRDISISLNKDKHFKAIEEVIVNNAKQYLKDIAIVDRYKGKEEVKDQTIFTLRIFYQAQTRTLTAQEVDDLHMNIRNLLSCQTGVSLR